MATTLDEIKAILIDLPKQLAAALSVPPQPQKTLTALAGLTKPPTPVWGRRIAATNEAEARALIAAGNWPNGEMCTSGQWWHDIWADVLYMAGLSREELDRYRGGQWRGVDADLIWMLLFLNRVPLGVSGWNTDEWRRKDDGSGWTGASYIKSLLTPGPEGPGPSGNDTP